MRKLLISGANGFLGRHVARKFKENGYYVIGIGHGSWPGEPFTDWGIDRWIEATISPESLGKVASEIDITIHCAGGGSVGLSYSNPYADFQRTVQSTLAILEFIRQKNPRCLFIYPSSVAVLGNAGSEPIREDSAGLPVSPYGFHKRMAEDLCRSYHAAFGIPVRIVRFFSVYGSGLKKQLLWDACNKIRSTGKLMLSGSGREVRDWIHVHDAAALLYRLSEASSGFDIINGGTGTGTSVSKVMDLLRSCFGEEIEVIFDGHVRPGDPGCFLADATKAKATGWAPQVTLEAGLQSYVEYFKKVDK